MLTRSLPNEQLIPAIERLIAQGHSVTFCVKGRSMRPFLDDGRDCVVLAPCTAGELKAGDVVLAEDRPHHYVLHRIERITPAAITLRGDGNPYGRETCTPDRVIGRATAFVRKGRKRPDRVKGAKFRLYSALYPSSPFLRRVVLYIYRHLP